MKPKVQKRFGRRTWLLLVVLLFAAATWVWTQAEKERASRRARLTQATTSPPFGLRLTGHVSWNGGGQTWPFEIVMEGSDRYYRKETFPKQTNLMEVLNPTSRIRGGRNAQVLGNQASDPKGLHYSRSVAQRPRRCDF
ncbi:MAG: hypothetical protein ABSA47_04925, partial [Verrucomicrobiota bacterium]